ncbi:hypothetical protein DPMN_111011 [Dreissena polymorpha]|uniref:Uncharacterized protein n=1 Tax=Dreissena polymorpha TaxID=45954 RepID=A0A9D4QNL2_DREPO|nr:hypothetical protein DPMN_111011 [Dreissena polymorpha]
MEVVEQETCRNLVSALACAHRTNSETGQQFAVRVFCHSKLIVAIYHPPQESFGADCVPCTIDDRLCYRHHHQWRPHQKEVHEQQTSRTRGAQNKSALSRV